jgi:hypothetical protein
VYLCGKLPLAEMFVSFQFPCSVCGFILRFASQGLKQCSFHEQWSLLTVAELIPRSAFSITMFNFDLLEIIARVLKKGMVLSVTVRKISRLQIFVRQFVCFH